MHFYLLLRQSALALGCVCQKETYKLLFIVFLVSCEPSFLISQFYVYGVFLPQVPQLLAASTLVAAEKRIF